jgi:hypothetical protein
VILIEAFPINIIANLPEDRADFSPPSGGRGDESFAGVFTSYTSVNSSHQSTSREGKGIEKDEKGLALGDHSPATNLVGVSEKGIPYTQTQPQSQKISASSQGILGDDSSSPAQKGILSRLGLTQGEIDKFSVVKDPGLLKELLLKLGLSTNEAEQFVSGNPSGLRGEEGLLNKLINLLEQKGVPPSQAREIGKMLAELKVELLQIDRPLAVEGKPQCGIKDLLLQLGIHPEDADKMIEEGEISDRLSKILLKLGIHPEEADRMVKEGEISIDRLSKILLKLGIRPEDVQRLIVTEKMPIQNLKAYLIEMGVNPKEVAKLVEIGKHLGKEVSIKELLVLLNRNIQNLSEGDEAQLSEKLSLGNNNTPNNSRGEVDLNGRGNIDSNVIVSKEVEGGRAQVDFEQVVFKMELRESSTAQKVMEQIVKAAKLQVVNGQARARISLHPPSLGKLHMHIITKENQVRATFFAETPQVKGIIESNLTQLRQSFLQQGLKVEHFNVFVGYHPGGNQTEEHGLFDSGKLYHSEREGLNGEDSLTTEKARERAVGNHMVDLFI